MSPRKVRKDITVAGIERKLKLPKGTIRHSDTNRKVRKDKKLQNMQ